MVQSTMPYKLIFILYAMLAPSLWAGDYLEVKVFTDGGVSSTKSGRIRQNKITGDFFLEVLAENPTSENLYQAPGGRVEFKVDIPHDYDDSLSTALEGPSVIFLPRSYSAPNGKQEHQQSTVPDKIKIYLSPGTHEVTRITGEVKKLHDKVPHTGEIVDTRYIPPDYGQRWLNLFRPIQVDLKTLEFPVSRRRNLCQSIFSNLRSRFRKSPPE
jgi:hypothetical protein